MLRPYSAKEPFRFWCQKVLPLVYDDSLSYYEMLCKTVDYLNTMVNNVNSLGTAFNDLQDMVTNYFDNLDVQQEINNKLDEMVTNGTLSALIEPLVGDAVSEWLDDHPEATTTVQNNSLTEAKFTEALRLKTLKDYVTPEMYGAKGDGTTDDTEAFNQALATGKPVYLGIKTYRLASQIDNPSTFYLFGSGKSSKTVIKCESSFIKNTMVSSIIKNVRVEAPFENELVAFPNIVRGSKISGCSFHYWYGVFRDVEGVSKIEDNSFQFIRGYFCRILIDSFIMNNYIDAPKLTNPQTVCFSNTIAHSVISGNFIDYMYKVFGVAHLNGVTVVGNVFDVCYTIFYNVAVEVTFTGNLISNLKKRSDWDVSGNTEMDTQPWCVIRRTQAAAPLTNCVFSGNTFVYEEFDAYMVCTSNSYPTRFVTIDDDVPSDKITFRAYKSGNAYDMQKVFIRPMIKRNVESLPSPKLTGSVVSFPFDEVIYNGDLYININGAWKQITGTPAST